MLGAVQICVQIQLYTRFSAPNALSTQHILLRCLLLMLVVMSLFHVDKYDDKLIGLCVKDQVH